ncbi:MAG: peptidase M22 [Clostridiales bacterium]|nr:peptidase M22 [Clostridiales bacterium]
MSLFLGIDTSNYTTSLALYKSESQTYISKRKVLEVKKGQKGLRQSEALFLHIKNLPELMRELFAQLEGDVGAIGVSLTPRDIEGSYMPCFLAGSMLAESLAAFSHKPLYTSSHQAGHIFAALLSADRLDLMNENFIAFHVSGGTTEVLLVKPKSPGDFKIKLIGATLDLNAGQAVDRVSHMLGLGFPGGPELEKLAEKSKKKYKPTVPEKGLDCSLSGLENLCLKMLESEQKPEDIARFCLDYIALTLDKMTKVAKNLYGDMPLLYTGGVMSNKLIGGYLARRHDCIFAKPELSVDNAVGLALMACLRHEAVESPGECKI